MFADADADGVTLHDGDCDDQDKAVFPSAPELCDGIDNDCDGLIDQADDSLVLSGLFLDADGDGYGQEPATSCDAWLTVDGGDCDDTDPQVNPSAEELCDNGVDDNCDGSAEECVWTGRYKVRDIASWSMQTDGSLAGPAMQTNIDSDGDQDLEVALLLDFGSGRAIRGFEFSRAAAGSVYGEPIFDVPIDDSNGLFAYVDGSRELGKASLVLSATSGFYAFHGPLHGTLSLDDADLYADSGWYGFSVGDLNYDGLNDIGALRLAGDDLVTYLVSVDGSGYLDPEKQAYASLLLDISGATLGTPSRSGDLNGDGVDDLTIATPGYSNNQGRIDILYGPLLGEMTSKEADESVLGDGPQGLFGVVVNRLGDVDGDGRDDIIITSPNHSVDGVSVGSLYLMGYAGGGRGLDVIARLDGATSQDYAGIMPTHSASGDLSGDGLNDIVFGALSSSNNDPGGIVYVHYAPLSGTVSVEDANAVFLGVVGDEAVLGAIGGDYNGDGLDDLIIGNDLETEDSTALYMIPGMSI